MDAMTYDVSQGWAGALRKDSRYKLCLCFALGKKRKGGRKKGTLRVLGCAPCAVLFFYHFPSCFTPKALLGESVLVLACPLYLAGDTTGLRPPSCA